MNNGGKEADRNYCSDEGKGDVEISGIILG
jgi:hypothetical protein